MKLESIKSGNVSIKVLTTNTTSITLLTEDKFKGKVIQPEAAANRAVGEHGLALLVTVKEGEKESKLLMDAGGLLGTVVDNCKQFNIDLGEVDKMLLSHSHFDHFGGLKNVMPLLKEETIFYLSPLSYQTTYSAITNTGEVIPASELPDYLKNKKEIFRISNKLPPLSKKFIENLAAQNKVEIKEINAPMELYKGITTSGQIKISNTAEVTKGLYIMKGRKEFEENTFREEIALYINIEDKGLVVITGCGHCGIVNIIKHGQELTGVEKIYAVIGGFHEEWNDIDKINEKVDYFKSINPEIICGMHCTGFTFNKLMSDHPAHTLGVSGTEFHL